ncbi:MAG: ester cyclase [Bacteroidota bacterium]
MEKIIHLIVIAIILVGCNTQAEKPVERTIEKIIEKPVETVIEKEVYKPSAEEVRNREIALRFYEEVINVQNVDALDKFCSPNYLEHQYDTHFDSDLKGVKKAFKEYFRAFPDMHVKVNFMMAEGDLLTAHITTTGTNTGSIYGQKPTNKKMEINGVDITRFKNGKVEEHWGFAEEGKLLTQLGLIRPLMKEGRKEQIEAARRKEYKAFPGSTGTKAN